jgi:3',5'-nucleoside bisphosphate phosphatase
VSHPRDITATVYLESGLIYDLHTHSNASDGTLTPEALVLRAKSRGVTHLALTDHDTTDGLQRAGIIADQEGICLISGIEFSAQWQGIGVHVIGLNLDPQAEQLRAAVALQGRVRIERAEEIGRRLAKLGIADAHARAQVIADGAIIGRPHFARFLIENGHVANMNAAFKRYLGAGKAGDVKHGWPEIPQVIDDIRSAGGVAVLAHPNRYDLTLTKLRRLIAFFTESGGQAMEVVSGLQDSGQTASMQAIATQFGLYASCGSDFHVPDQPWQELGSFSVLPKQATPVWHLWQ